MMRETKDQIAAERDALRAELWPYQLAVTCWKRRARPEYTAKAQGVTIEAYALGRADGGIVVQTSRDGVTVSNTLRWIEATRRGHALGLRGTARFVDMAAKIEGLIARAAEDA